MTWITLNIGLAVDGTEALTAHVAREILAANGILRRDDGVVHTSDTEKTLVVVDVALKSGLAADLAQTAVDLRQDCIACCWQDAHGYRGQLFGPKAAAWGPFNPAFFLLADGSRLSDSLAVLNAA